MFLNDNIKRQEFENNKIFHTLDIFSKIIFVLLNLKNNHWTLAVILVPSKTFIYFDSLIKTKLTLRKKNHFVMKLMLEVMKYHMEKGGANFDLDIDN